MAFHADWYLWGGGAAVGAVAEYADVKMKPVTGRLTNGELVAGLTLIAQAFGAGDRNPRTWGRLLDGGAGWAAGMITEGLVRRGMFPAGGVVATTPAGTATAHSAGATVSGVRAVNPTGSVGIPASAASAAFDLPMGGY